MSRDWKVDGYDRDGAYIFSYAETKEEAVAFWTLCKMRGCYDLDLYRRLRNGMYVPLPEFTTEDRT